MHIQKGKGPLRGQAGFSMVEMLMTAFILAVGILGLSMLQAMSLKASRGSRGLTMAVLVAEQVMDQVEMEARLSWLDFTNPSPAAPTANPNLSVDLPNLRYITRPSGDPLVETFNGKGGPVVATSTDQAENVAYFTVTTTRTASNAATVIAHTSDVAVQVQFNEGVDANNAPIRRTVTLTRKVVHG